MKAKIKATGEVVDVEPLFYSELSNTNPMIHRAELEFQPTLIDWEQRRYELAKAAMQGFIANTDLFDRFEDTGDTRSCICSDAVGYADDMIDQLKRVSRCD